MASGKTKALFVIDAIIALAFLAAGMSAVAFLIPYSAIDFSTSSAAPTFVGLTYGFWRNMHLYAGLAMIVGGIVHFAMHWGWMVRTARGMVPGASTKHRASVAPAQSREIAATAQEAPDA